MCYYCTVFTRDPKNEPWDPESETYRWPHVIGMLEWPELTRLFDDEPDRGSARAATSLVEGQEPPGEITRSRFGSSPSQWE